MFSGEHSEVWAEVDARNAQRSYRSYDSFNPTAILWRGMDPADILADDAVPPRLPGQVGEWTYLYHYPGAGQLNIHQARLADGRTAYAQSDPACAAFHYRIGPGFGFASLEYLLAAGTLTA